MPSGLTFATPPVLEGIVPCTHRGKVRDTYRLPGWPRKRLLHVTRRLSTHNVVHLSEIPYKDEVLVALTLYWGRLLENILGVRTHTVAYGHRIYDYLPKGVKYPADLHLQAIVIQLVDMFPWELIYRGRMGGSLWTDYYSLNKPNPYGLELPPGMQLMDEFPTPIFTPTDKSDNDDPVTSQFVEEKLGTEVVAHFKTIYEFMRAHALEQGIEMLDTKEEGGRLGGAYGDLCVADEWGTPDCSRFVEAKSIVVGQEPEWLDKQYARNEAKSVWKEVGKGKFPITFSDVAIRGTTRRNHEIVERLTGMTLFDLQKDLGLR